MSTQDFLPIEDIRDDLVFLKDGSVSLVITTSAVNFGLLFETEQIAIIEAFAGFLNSLSFPIQITIHSQRLDISSYLTSLDNARAKLTNPLLLNMITYYRKFVEGLIKDKDVLDKQFYITLNVSSLELGFLKHNLAERSKKAATILSPRRDHILRQLKRIGLKLKQLTTPELIKLFYDFFNPIENQPLEQAKPTILTTQVVPQINIPRPVTLPFTSHPQSVPYPKPLGPAPHPANTGLENPTPIINAKPLSNNHQPPFIVEELPDDFGS